MLQYSQAVEKMPRCGHPRNSKMAPVDFALGSVAMKVRNTSLLGFEITDGAGRSAGLFHRLTTRLLPGCLVLMVAVLLADGALAADPVNIAQVAPNGSKGSDEFFEPGKSGGSGASLSQFTYTFADPLTSTMAGLAAFQLSRTAGSGGGGGSSTGCCDGGRGGVGGAVLSTMLDGTATLATTQANSPGLSAVFVLGSGGNGGDSGTCCKGGNGGEASTEAIGVPALTLNSYNATTKTNVAWTISTQGVSSPALEVISRAGNGGPGGTGASEGSTGGMGGVAAAVTVGQSGAAAQTFSLNATTTGNQSPGVSIQSSPFSVSSPTPAGFGGPGGANDTASGGDGNDGGKPQPLSITLGASTITTTGDGASGIILSSQGGTGGRGGSARGAAGTGGTGGQGGGGGEVLIELYDDNIITTHGETSYGIAGFSIGGEGGQDGQGSFIAKPGKPGAGSASGAVTIDALYGYDGTSPPTGRVITYGDNAIGLNAQSIGGYGRSAATNTGLVPFGVSGGSAGNGGLIEISNALTVRTDGNNANAINGQSIGGGGGNGGSSFGEFYSQGGSGGAGGDGHGIEIVNTGIASTGGFDSSVIYAQSVGGAGGTGGSAGALVGFGGRAGPGANGGTIVVINTGSLNAGANATGTAPATLCPGCSFGILAHSVGGGGGKAGSTGGWFAIGGTGGGGGGGGDTTVNNAGSITTRLASSSAIMAQSVGGGGGAGGAAVSAGVLLSASVGGSGGAGGNGGQVEITSVPTAITGDLKIQTTGDMSHGIAAQSVGGGGGHGGFAVSTSVGIMTPSVAVAVGGSGGQGGHGSSVTISSQSADSQIASLSTTGDHSFGIFGKSIGGGGGTGGASIAGTLSVGSSIGGGISVGVGGSGGTGGNGGEVDITSGGNVATSGLSSPGVVGLSIGGGGGGGGLSVAANVSVGSAGIDVGVGGKGGTAGDGGAVSVKQLSGTLTTKGDHAEAILAQSVGGGGGRGATSIAAGLSTTGEVNVSLGGSGGAGGAATTVTVEATSDISTGDAMAGTGDHSAAVVAQSLGGGGGHGGLSIGAAATTSSALSIGVSLGGKGGAGGDAGGASIQSSGKITSAGDHAAGLMSQSIGGGGGNGGLSIAGSLSLGSSIGINVSVGGSGGTAGNSVNTLVGGIAALVDNTGSIATQGAFSSGIISQSIGGGGGNGGLSVAGTITSSSTSAQASVGGNGSGGGAAGFTVVCNGKDDQTIGTCGGTENSGGVSTTGESSHGILAQSIGGAGGHSGISIAGSSAMESSIGISVGGNAGAGGAGGAVFVYSEGTTSTGGNTSNGILAQSVGGSGGASYATISASGLTTDSINVSIGGSGGSAGDSDAVTVIAADTLSTAGALSDGISAISVAGSGGHGGIAASATGTAQGTDIGVAVGGAGGGGGKSGNVSVSWNGAKIATKGDQSVGLYAHSGGGSGGRGGMVINGQLASVNDVAVSVGGAGGAGGVAGTSAITTTIGQITTAGSLAPAIAVSSLGGNGGRGGATVATTGVSQRNVAVTLGGSGGTGGTAGAASVASNSTIDTTGTYSEGIFVQSLAGHGGAGGWVAEGGLSTVVQKGNAGSVNVNLGGKGGPGGAAGAATIQNSGAVTTADFGSTGLYAQSVGGDGGQGGAVYSGQVNVKTAQTSDVAVNVGGSGGAGGTGGGVTVDNTGDIGTKQADSDAVFAQSVGGSGGKGGSSYSVLLNLAAQSESSQSFQVTVGGSGGSGAIGGPVSVSNASDLTTAGTSSVGIYAQSIGGGGGAGGAGGNMLVSLGNAQPQSKSTTIKVDIAVGGSGGTAAHASTVGVTNAMSGAIKTTGASAHGIFAQSIGGGGGDGGTASGYNLNISGVCSLSGAKTFSYSCRNSEGGESKTTYAANVNVGGSGGAGGNGSAATVTNDGTISTTGLVSHGIVAQSVGGGGGTGGDGSTGIGAFTSNETAAEIAEIIKKATELDPYELLTSWTSFGLSIGGKGGASGTGAAVSAFNNGTISTTGTSSYGVLAQSIGGGGGAGGSAASAPIHSLSIGGSGAGGGDGGAVSVTGVKSASISTAGDAAFGILAQSVGGGGGATGSRTSVASGKGLSFNIALTIGGKNGVSGNGDAVTVNNANTAISTGGRAAVGIFAQSIGGGGGLASDGLAGASGTVSVAGASGNGGTVNVTHNGTINTGTSGSGSLSFAAHGIVAQSIGGGGGYGGAVVMGTTGRFGNGLPMASDGKAAIGNGGAVTVTATGSIRTQGGSSMGIFAQSVGGGGGVAGNTDTTSQSGAWIGNGGGTGVGGPVVVNYGGSTASTLWTFGDGAHGIFVQSMGGKSTGTSQSPMAVVNLKQAVVVSGAGAHGIYAESAGQGIGSIEITIDSTGSVVGGANATISGVEDGAAIFVKDGTSSTITNKGMITAGQSGIAINALETNLTFNNTGTYSGSILKKMSSVQVDNQRDGVFRAERLLDVDQFVNAGVLYVAGEGKAGETKLTGDFRQKSKGVLVSDLDFGNGISGDLLTIDGNAVLDGTVDVNPVGPLGLGDKSTQRGSVEIVHASGGLTRGDGLSVKQSAAVDYELRQPTNESLRLSWDIDFANEDILSRTNHNQDELAHHIQKLFLSGALLDFALPETIGLLEIETVGEYATAADSLSPEPYLNTQLSTLYSAQAFAQKMMSCSSRDGTYRFVRQTECAWIDIGGSRFKQDRNSVSTGFDASTFQLAGGAQFEVAPDFHIGGAMAYVDSALDMDFANSDGHTFQLGVVAKKRFGPAMLAASISGGYGEFDTSRRLATGTYLEGDQKIWNVSGMVRGSYTFEQKNRYVTPRLDFGVDYVNSGDVVESGSNPFGLEVNGGGNTFYWVRPAVEFGGEIELANGTLLRPDVTLGFTQFIGGNDLTTNAQFSMTPNGLDGFTSEAQLDRSYLDLSAGLEIITKSNLTVEARAFGRLSENSETFGGLLQIELRF